MTTKTKADTARHIADTALVWLMALRVVVVTALLGSAVVAEVSLKSIPLWVKLVKIWRTWPG